MRASREKVSQSWIATAALFTPLILLLLVTVMTWRAERRYAAVTERVVRDYSAIAAWQFARRANGALHDEVMAAFGGVAPGHQRSSHAEPLLPPERILGARPNTSAALLREARFVFTFDLASGNFQSAGQPVDDAFRSALQERLRAIAASARRDAEPHRLLFDSAGGASYALALWTLSAADSPIRAAYGVVSDPDAVAPVLTRIIGEASLLPATKGSEKLTANDLAIRLTRPDGGTVFATPVPFGATAASDTSGVPISNVRTTVDIPPHVANALLLEGHPSSQLPALLLMLAIAAGLAFMGLTQQRRARELERLRSRFVANVSHELRTPLAQISMFAETLSLGRERSDAERRSFASIIFSEARRLTTLVESVLRFSRGDTQRERLHVEPLVMRDEVECAVAAFEPVATSADAVVETTSTGNAHALVDRAAFRQIMLNLLDNAVKHGGRGTTVSISVASAGSNVEIVVDDSGRGIPPEWRDRVFEPFVRIDQGNVAGAGIGLAVVHDLVTAHHGTVRIEDSPLGGARFVVSLPSASPRPGESSLHVEQTSV